MSLNGGNWRDTLTWHSGRLRGEDARSTLGAKLSAVQMAFFCNRNRMMSFVLFALLVSEISLSGRYFLSNKCLYEASDQNRIPEVSWYRGINIVDGPCGIVEKFWEE